jgi:hypothetical protein
MVRGAIQSAFSLGLHVQQEDCSTSAARQQSLVDTWWSLHALESLLSSITGRPGTLPGEEITTPTSKTFYAMSGIHGQDASRTINMAFLHADSCLNLLTQQVMSGLYTQRKSAPSWSHVQQTMVALVGDLDKWAVDCVPHFHSEVWAMDLKQQRDNSLLKLQYYRVKILTTRPSLRRIERSTETGSGDFTNLDQSMAEACIRAANDVATLLGTVPDIAALYEKGPWWTIVHNGKSFSPCGFTKLTCCLRSYASTRYSHERNRVSRTLCRLVFLVGIRCTTARWLAACHARDRRCSSEGTPSCVLFSKDIQSIGLGQYSRRVSR